MLVEDVFHSSPAEDPLSYPGRFLETSYLLLPGKRALPIEERVERRLGQCWVDAPGEAASLGWSSCTSLNYVLVRENAAPIDTRYAVLAIGSNAAPAQLARKFARRGISSVIPVMRADVRGLKVVPSAHLNPKGYIPAAPAAADEASMRRMFVTFLDDEQLCLLDETEPNYKRVSLNLEWHSVQLLNKEQLGSCYVYRSLHGVIADHRVPSSFGSLSDQRTLLGAVLAVLPELRDQGLTVESLLASLHDGSLDDVSITRAMHDHLDVRDAALHTVKTTGLRYEDVGDLDHQSSMQALAVIRSRTATPGESSCAVSPATARTFALNRHVAVREPHHKLEVVARLVIDAELGDQCVRLDQTLRNALGVELREKVVVAPAKLPVSRRTRWADKTLGESRYLLARVQAADLATVEQDACVLAPLALELLGVSPGEQVILEGTTDSAGNVRTMRARAFRAPEDMLSLRQEVSGGELTARFPSSRDALGVYPDLPWAFLDARTRSILGVEKLGPVRVRAERGQQTRIELRELSLIIALALFGVLTSDFPPAVKWSALILIVSVIVTVVVIRLRWRLGRAAWSR